MNLFSSINYKKYYKLALLLAVPSLFLTMAIFFHLDFGRFSELSVDPEYFFLYNGIVIAKGSLAINFIDHPATPLIYVAAVASRLVHLFTADSKLVVDFLNDPEKYLLAANILHNFFIATALYISSKKILKYTSSMLVALVFQMGILYSPAILMAAARLLPESTILISVFLLIALSLKYVFTIKGSINLKKLRWQFALIIAFGIASKLSFVPFIFFPLILIESNWKYKFQLIAFCFLFFVVLAYPMFTNIEVSLNWVSNLLTHSGKHGTGDTNFIKLTEVSKNLSLLWEANKLFFVSIIIAVPISFFLALQKNKSILQVKLIRLLYAYIASIILLLLLVLKHFALHYMIPFYFFSLLPLLVFILYIKDTLFSKNKFIFKKQLCATLSFLAIIIAVPKVLEASKKNDYRTKSNREVQLKNISIRSMIKEKDHILIADPIYYGSPFIECAHIQGFMKSYRRKTNFKSQLRSMYPNFYLYVSWDEGFNHWDEFVGLNQIFENPKTIYVYVGEKMKGINKIEERIYNYNSGYKKEELYSNSDNQEYLFRYYLP